MLFAAAAAVGPAAASGDVLAGECSRVYREIARGAGFVGYVFGASSDCGMQELSAVTFDPTSNDLLLGTAVNASGATLSQTVAEHFRSEKRRVVAALGSSDALEGYTVAEREIVFAESGATPSFGVTADGSALFGEITFSAEVKNRRTGEIVPADSVNCASTAAAIYTYRAIGELPDAAALIAVDVPYDCTLAPGVPIEGTVSAIYPGDRVTSAKDRIVVAVFDAADAIGFEIGDRVTVTADVSDALGNTALWRTANFAISGLTALVRDGEATAAEGGERAASGVIGVRPDGSLMMLASYGGLSTYSLGFTRGELAAPCVKLGMVDAVLLGTGDSVEMLAADESGALRATGRPAAKEFAPVASALLISVPDENANLVIGEYEDHPADILSAKSAGYSLRLLETGGDALRLTCRALIRGDDGAAHHAPAAQPYEASAEASDLYVPINSLYKQLEFDSTGEWLTLVIKKSDLEAWYGKIYRNA